MNRASQSGWRRLGRVLTTLLLGHSLAIVVAPLTVGLAIHAIAAMVRGEHEHGWSPREWIQCVGLIVALCLFALLAVSHLCTSIYTSWSRNGDGSLPLATGAAHRLDAVVTRAHLLKRINALATSRRLYGPVARKEPRCEPPVRYFYEEVSRAEELALEFSHCVYGPKAIVLPPRETLLTFDRENGRFRATPCFDDRPTALIGAHPCDLAGLRVLDEVFGKDHRDEHYQVRRQNLFVVGIDCARPCSDESFCRDTHTNDAETGFDVMLYPLGSPDESVANASDASNDEFGAVFGSDAGRAWLLASHDVGHGAAGEIEDEHSEPAPVRNETGAGPADRQAVRRLDAYLTAKHRAFHRKLGTDWGKVPELLERSYDSLVWQGMAQRCYSCGSCNQVCPTCYCFDIQDCNSLALDGGCRERTWDACMLGDFALVAGGHNFRADPAQRLRHRIHRKGAWIHERTGLTGCVGCGRCTRACTAKISITDVLNQLADEGQAEKHEDRAAVGARGG